ncbi:MAG: type I-E CRISPR-associated protein Cas7/Cse4/CasC [Rhodobacteraceae bacterium]|nr:type I-E CRISPR-associated protein Cas7/Cse4/CasC [Paracoccaceae bacterium]
MTEQRFLQIHTLTAYTAALLNRDDTGLAKRLRFGGTSRTRISSQCLKRHWRLAEDPHALNQIDGAESAYRSRELVTKKVVGTLSDVPKDVVEVIEPTLQTFLYGDKGLEKKSRQTLLFGEAELAWLAREARSIADEADGDPEVAKLAAEAWGKSMKGNLKAMVEAAAIPGGITGALFGRMVTSDPNANISAPIHVAHAFTVHQEESESDYFTALDDLAEEGVTGADTIQDTELTSGLFYGYVVIDLPGLRSNLGNDARLVKEVLHSLVYLISEVSPGAKLGSTAPYGRAAMMILEVGNRQPRSLANAFRDPCAPSVERAESAIRDHLAALDAAYDTGEARRVMSLSNVAIPGATPGNLSELANWARELA